MLASEETRKNFMDAIAKRGLVLEVLNCYGNQLAPNEEGRQHQEVVEKTFKLAGLLGVKKIVMMSGCPGGSPTDTTPNWIVTSWPPITTKILNWQWEEVLIPYWKKTVKLAIPKRTAHICWASMWMPRHRHLTVSLVWKMQLLTAISRMLHIPQVMQSV